MVRENNAPTVWSLSSVLRLREREKRKTLVISLPMQARFFSHSLESYSHFVIITFSYCFTCCNARTLVFVAMCTAKKSLWETENKIDLRHKKYYVWPFSSILFFFGKGKIYPRPSLTRTSAGEFRNSISQDRRRKQRERGKVTSLYFHLWCILRKGRRSF